VRVNLDHAIVELVCDQQVTRLIEPAVIVRPAGHSHRRNREDSDKESREQNPGRTVSLIV
jgi:hypothetical protein